MIADGRPRQSGGSRGNGVWEESNDEPFDILGDWAAERHGDRSRMFTVRCLLIFAESDNEAKDDDGGRGCEVRYFNQQMQRKQHQLSGVCVGVSITPNPPLLRPFWLYRLRVSVEGRGSDLVSIIDCMQSEVSLLAEKRHNQTSAPWVVPARQVVAGGKIAELASLRLCTWLSFELCLSVLFADPSSSA